MRINLRLMQNVLVVACLLTPLSSPGQDSAAEKRLISIDDQASFRSIGSPVFSADGQWLAYTVTTGDYEKNQSLNRIWMQPAQGGSLVALTAAGVSSWSPVFSKDGRTLYFLSARDEQKTQLWSLNLVAGGEAQQVTELERGVDQINFSSDEKKLLLVLRDEDQSEPLVEGSNPWVIDRLDFKKDAAGTYLDRLRTHIYIYDLATKQLTQITSGDFDDSDPAWSPDDRQVAFTSFRNPGDSYNSDIWLVDAKAGAAPRQLTSNQGADSAPLWHPDGDWLVFTSAQGEIEPNYAVNHLARLNINKLEHQWFSLELDRNIWSPEFSADGKQVYFRLEDSGEEHIARLGWSDKRFERVLDGKRVISSFALGAGNQLAAVFSTSVMPGELHVLQDGKPRAITGVNTALIDQLKLGETREIHYQAPDGWEIEGFVTLPPDYRKGQRYPAILKIHGGPVGQYDVGFSFDSQLLAAHGYVVIKTNPRGSSGYGQEFTLGLYQGWGEKDYQDVLAGVDRAIELGYADPDRLGMGGYSYGGILTNYLLGKTDRFKAAVSGAGSGHYLASYGHDIYRLWYETELGLPWENRELWESLSPFNYIHEATTPTLFYGGNKDWNVPIQGSEQLYQVMKRVGVETLLVVYPDEHHGGWSYANEKDSWLRRLAWYDRFLKN
ncbi:MAG: S9 family peptidase [Xanthomonadales bacterium]|nr:S9 family peptidase [Xanthomonadales bacterium]MDH3941922.1 S9 family peptidase [Xanthomonadales bacterium]MDH4001621.1 S9 family peptidase [Xanthomonadales bacterium]